MQQVTGWLTEDKTFFVQREEAALYEATKYLEAALMAFAGPKADFERFMYVVNNLRQELGSYFNAAQALQDREEAERDDGRNFHTGNDARSNQEAVEPDPPDLGLGEVLNEADEQQPAGGPDAMPYMGTRALAEALRNLGEGDGSGGGGVDAQGIRDGADMATVAAPEVGEARNVHGSEAVWADVDAHLEGRGRVQARGPARSASEHVLRDIAQRGMARQPDRRNENDG